MTQTPDDFWEEHRNRIQHAVMLEQYGDPTTDLDNKVPGGSWVMKAAVREAVLIFIECGIFIDPARLRRLLQYVTGEDLPTADDGPSYDLHREAHILLEQLP